MAHVKHTWAPEETITSALLNLLEKDLTDAWTELGKKAAKSDLDIYAKTSDLSDYANVADLNAYAKTSSLSVYAKTADLASYAKKTDLPSIPKGAAVADATEETVLDQVNALLASLRAVNLIAK